MLDDIIKDMTKDQLRDMLTDFAVKGTPVTRANIKGWKKRNRIKP